uniref:Uncharacterized protein n=1 Tax=Glossina pallidipes TaxID=7398 RepID=A0A1B0A516_GLOPL
MNCLPSSFEKVLRLADIFLNSTQCDVGSTDFLPGVKLVLRGSRSRSRRLRSFSRSFLSVSRNLEPSVSLLRSRRFSASLYPDQILDNPLWSIQPLLTYRVSNQNRRLNILDLRQANVRHARHVSFRWLHCERK